MSPRSPSTPIGTFTGSLSLDADRHVHGIARELAAER